MPPFLEYGKPPPRDGWQMRRALDWLVAACFAGAVFCAVMSYVLSHKLRTPTPEFVQFQLRATFEAATRPEGTVVERPEFTGRAYVPRPILTLPTTWIALGLLPAGVALFLLSQRLRRPTLPAPNSVQNAREDVR